MCRQLWRWRMRQQQRPWGITESPKGLSWATRAPLPHLQNGTPMQGQCDPASQPTSCRRTETKSGEAGWWKSQDGVWSLGCGRCCLRARWQRGGPGFSLVPSPSQGGSDGSGCFAKSLCSSGDHRGPAVGRGPLGFQIPTPSQVQRAEVRFSRAAPVCVSVMDHNECFALITS